MTRISEELLAVGGIPYLHLHIIASGGDPLSIGRPCHCMDDKWTVPIVGRKPISACSGIPDMHRFIITTGGNVLTGGRPCYCIDSKLTLPLVWIGEELLTRGGIPDLYCFIVASGGDPLSI